MERLDVKLDDVYGEDGCWWWSRGNEMMMVKQMVVMGVMGGAGLRKKEKDLVMVIVD